MVFSSMVFIFVFLPAVILLYYIFPWRAWRNTLLCVSSLFFYAWGEPIYVLIMFFSVLLNYCAGLLLQNTAGQKRGKFILVVAVMLNLVALIFFKYVDFFIININTFFSLDIRTIGLSLPIGISFYTFQALSYIIDVYRRKITPQKNPVYLAMYIAFFPQLIAGPIVRYTDIAADINGRKETLEGFVSGLMKFFFGLAAKVILANNLAVFADSVFSDYTDASSLILWIASVSYMLQIFFDFAGYSLMAIGLGRMFGFTFPSNFNKPYTAVSITDFWRRWHITLSTWFRDYVYIPLGGNRCRPARHVFNILVTWLLTGFWHGAEWNFILWGLYYALFLLFEKYAFSRFLPISTESIQNMKDMSCRKKAVIWFYKLVTLFIVLVGWVLFRVENISDLLDVLRTMFSFKAGDLSLYVAEHAASCSKLFYVIPGIIVAGSLPSYIIEKMRRSVSPNAFFALKAAVALVLFVISVLFLIASSYNPFIYFRF
ncbi:MAG: MBOAT family protein [Treponemataceae bacterium]|nr:MBOAT family protein [Treponemataceae bacterium]